VGSNNYCYFLNDYNNSIDVLSLENINNLTRINQIILNSINAIYIDNNTLITINDNRDNISLINISNPNNPFLINSLVFDEFIIDFKVQNHLKYFLLL